MSRPGDFAQPTIEALARRAGYRCSLNQQHATVGPAADPTHSIRTGRAAHIVAASPGGPRGNNSISPDERRSISNGVWLCAACADLVDKDTVTFSEQVLRTIKLEAERRARAQLLAEAPIPRIVRDPAEWSDEVADVLQKLYPGFPLTTFYGQRLATWAIRAPLIQREHPDSVLGGLEPALSSEDPYEAHDYDYRTRPCYEELMARPESDLHFNGALYAMTAMRALDDTIRLSCRPGRYFEARATSWELRREILQAVHDHGRSVTMEDLQLRKRLGDSAVLYGVRRCAEIAVSTVLFLEDSEGTWQVVVAPRSAGTGTEPFNYHVAPAGKFAPCSSATPAWRDDFSIRRTVYRELLEECLGYREFAGASWEGGSDLETLPEVQMLEAAIARGDAKFLLLGVCINLLNLLPEVCTALFIRDATWWLDNLVLNDEFALGGADLPAGYRSLQRVPLEPGFQLGGEYIAHLRPERWVQVGATALKLALDVAPEVSP